MFGEVVCALSVVSRVMLKLNTAGDCSAAHRAGATEMYQGHAKFSNMCALAPHATVEALMA